MLIYYELSLRMLSLMLVHCYINNDEPHVWVCYMLFDMIKFYSVSLKEWSLKNVWKNLFHINVILK